MSYPGAADEAMDADGAFQIGGGDYNFGQGYTEAIVRSMFSVPTPNHGNALALLAEQLSKMPLEALQGFKNLLPDVVEDTWHTVSGAVEAIMNSLTQVAKFLGLDQWQAFLNSVMGTAGATVAQVAEAINAAGEWLGHMVDMMMTALGLQPVGELLDKIFDLSDEIAWIQDRARDAWDGLGELINGLLTDPIGYIGKLPQKIVDGLATTLSNLGAGVNAVVLDLSNFITGLWNHPDNFLRDLPQFLVTGLPTALSNIGSSISKVVGDLAKLVQDLLTDPTGTIGKLTQEWVNGLPASLTNIGTRISTLISDLLTKPGQMLGQLAQSLITGLPTSLANLSTGVQNVVEDVLDLIDDLWNDPANVLRNLPQTLVSGLGTALTNLGSAIGVNTTDLSNFINLLKTNPAAAITSIPQTLVAGLGTALTNVGTRISTLISDLLAKPMEMIGKLGQDWVTGLPTILTNLSNGVLAVVSDLGSLVTDLWNNPANVLRNITQGMVSGLGSALTNVNSMIQSVIDGIASALKRVPIVGHTLSQLMSNLGDMLDFIDETDSKAGAADLKAINAASAASAAQTKANTADSRAGTALSDAAAATLKAANAASAASTADGKAVRAQKSVDSSAKSGSNMIIGSDLTDSTIPRQLHSSTTFIGYGDPTHANGARVMWRSDAANAYSGVYFGPTIDDDNYSVAPGERYAAEAQMYGRAANSGKPGFGFAFRFYDSTGANALLTRWGPVVPDAGGWNDVSFTVTVPDGYDRMRLLARAHETGTQAGDIYELRRISLREVTAARNADDKASAADTKAVNAGSAASAADVKASTAQRSVDLIAMDAENLVSGSDFAGEHPWSSSGWTVQELSAGSLPGFTHAYRRTASGSGSNTATLPIRFETKLGDRYYAEFWARQDTAFNGTTSNSKLRFGAFGDGVNKGLLHDQVTVSVTRPDWPVWS